MKNEFKKIKQIICKSLNKNKYISSKNQWEIFVIVYNLKKKLFSS